MFPTNEKIRPLLVGVGSVVSQKMVQRYAKIIIYKPIQMVKSGTTTDGTTMAVEAGRSVAIPMTEQSQPMMRRAGSICQRACVCISHRILSVVTSEARGWPEGVKPRQSRLKGAGAAPQPAPATRAAG